MLLLVAASCSVPHFGFSNAPAHCTNLISDEGETGLDCGGTCPACPSGGTCLVNNDCASNQCVSSLCLDASCSDGVQSGSETDRDCGGGGCSPCPSGKSCQVDRDCSSAVCTLLAGQGTCAEPTCTDERENGDESDVDCGGTQCDPCLPGRTCGLPSDCAGGECSEGICSVICVDGKGDCDGNPDNGCETNLKTTLDHCGACDTPCQLMHAEARCTGGTCSISRCTAPFADCDGNPKNGCETNTRTDVANCNGCGLSCPAVNGAPSCVAGACEISCDPGFTDCDDDRSNGCEANTASDATNCGKCRNVCDAGNATPRCNAGVCGVSDCPAGLGDCDGKPSNGCELPLSSDPKNCKVCGLTCVVANGTPQCGATGCEVASCTAPFQDCNLKYKDGCESNLTTDATNCGKCGTVCAFAHATPKCEGSLCKVSQCTLPFADCNADGTSCEVDTSTSASNCGGCGIQCLLQNASASACTGSVCKPTCNPPFAACSNPAAGCLTNLETAAHCGSCTNSCSGATPFCVKQACAAHLDMSVISSLVATPPAGGQPLSVSHVLQTAQASNPYRLLLVGVTGFGNNSSSLPTSVLYNAVPMKVAKSFAPVNQVSAAIYYLQDADLPKTAGTYSLLLTSAGSGSFVLTANVLELINVEQTTGALDATGGQASGAACTGHQPSDTVSVASDGELVYSVAGVYGQVNDPNPSLTGQIITEKLNSASLGTLAGYMQVPTIGPRTISWTVSMCSASAHALVSIKPAKTP